MATKKITTTVSEEDYDYIKKNCLSPGALLKRSIDQDRGMKVKSNPALVEDIPENNVVAGVWRRFLEKNPAIVAEMKKSGSL